MRRSLLFPAAVLALTACQVQKTQITNVADLPLKTTEPPSFEWSNAPLRANAQYILYEAHSDGKRGNLLGDYYFVSWDDAEPDKPAKLVMRYTQAKTGPKVLERTIDYPAPRDGKKTRKGRFFFNAANGNAGGDILTWRLELWSGGKLVDSRQSFLWK